MSNQHTAWHVLFVDSLAECGPPGFDVLAEQPLSTEPLRADVVVVRRRQGPENDSAARTLRGFWPLVRHTALIEFKSPTRPLHPGELAKLFGYGGQYHALHIEKLGSADNLLLVLVVAAITPTLRDELQLLRLAPRRIAGGYLRAAGRPYHLLIANLSAIVEADAHDDLMRIFVQSKLLSLFAKQFVERHSMNPSAASNFTELEGYHEVVQRFLRDLTPADRLEGLAEEHVILALSDKALRALSDEYLRELPPHVQQAIRARIGRPT